jgi:hypothetical protein
MADITSDCTVELVQGAMHSKKELIITTPNTADTSDYVDIDLTKFACENIEFIRGVVHTTENSIVVGEAPTTAVSSKVLRITLGGSTLSNKKRVYKVFIS